MEGTQEGFVDFICEQLSALGEIRSRRMFGGYCLYCREIPFALIVRNTLYLKADDKTRGDFERRRLEPFRPFPDRKTSMSYFLAPPEFFEDAEAAVHWARNALAAARRAQEKKPRKGRPTKKERGQRG